MVSFWVNNLNSNPTAWKKMFSEFLSVDGTTYNNR